MPTEKILPEISLGAGTLDVRWEDEKDGSLSATLSTTGPVRLAHLGWMLLKSVGRIGDIPEELREGWDSHYTGLNAKWRNSEEGKKRVASALVRTIEASRCRGAVLWDTMRGASDYWRPGKHVTRVADLVREQGYQIDYCRVDEICPTWALLASFKSSDMPFGQFALEYRSQLSTEHVTRTAATAIGWLAQGMLPVFSCVDPYIPGYGPRLDPLNPQPHDERPWLNVFRGEGCHRFVLTEAVARFLLDLGVLVDVYEIDPTAESFYKREFKPQPATIQGSSDSSPGP